MSHAAERSPAPDDSQPRSIRPLTDFLSTEAGAGVVLVVAAVVAMVWANSPWSDSYAELWTTDAVLEIGERALSLDLRGWVNDVGMVLFFFVVGLEIKRELTQGELRDRRQAALPIVAAVGGMVAPAIVYAVIIGGGDGAEGWGIPIATDIAIVVAVVALLGSRAPGWLKLFLLALAIVDDIGAITVIAVFYSDEVELAWLALSVATLLVTAVIRRRVPYVAVYVLLGVICWFGLHNAHVHPTLTGVAFGLLTPVVPRRRSGLVDADELAEGGPATEASRSVSVVEWLEHMLHPWSALLVVPLFALANAGVHIPPGELGEALSAPVTWAVVVGLVVGKTVGVSVASLLAVRFGVGRLPPGVTSRHVVGAGALAGIGFTVSLFVTELAFGESELGTHARLGVLIASVLAAALGAAICLTASVDDGSDRVHIFIYGTLQPGDVRWPLLEPFTDGTGRPDAVRGALYDTGHGYPAAVFDGDGTIAGRTYRLRADRIDEALAVLDAEESSVPGGYRRVTVTTLEGARAWAYEYGSGLELSPIPHGNWLDRNQQ
jgi:NhaA family Na+:H+ antiporter